jgi:outer membrane protein OmpA-like peptidoglycan-associated protein
MRIFGLLLVVAATGCIEPYPVQYRPVVLRPVTYQPRRVVYYAQPVQAPAPRPAPPPAPAPAPAPVVEAPPPPLPAQIDVPGAIEFEVDKAKLRHVTAETRNTLEAVYKIIQDHPSITRLRIEGHTDNDGVDQNNQSLSDHRASAVLEWLVAKGIQRNRLFSIGCGSTAPLVANDSRVNKQRNRRTEFHIEELDGKQPTDYTPPCSANRKRGFEAQRQLE